MNTDSLLYQAYEVIDSLKGAIRRTGNIYTAQTGDNGAAVETLVYVLLILAGLYFARDILRWYFERKDRKEEIGNLQNDRQAGRSELLSAVERIRTETVSQIEQLDKRVTNADSRISKLEGKAGI